MKHKTLTTTLGLILLVGIFLIGVVTAGNRTLYNLSGINIPLDVVAGNNFGADFSFRYLDDFVNVDSSPLIIQLNFSSGDEEYPVWRNDFEVSGRVEKYALWGLIHTGTVLFKCNNSESQVIEHSLDSQEILGVSNGTFYCYDEGADLKLEEYDEVYLDITSHPALWPGKYNLTASMFYLIDGRAPFVNITNKGLFEKYYRENDNVLVRATISDASGISEKWTSVTLAGAEIFLVNYDHFENDEYYFSMNTPVNIVENDYELFVFAEDGFGNRGNDSVALKIDRSPPVISLISPIDGVYEEILPIKFNVTDNKSGVDNNSVKVRLREIINGTIICPEIGGPIGKFSCTTTNWINLSYNTSSKLFEKEINVTKLDLTSGEYWLDAVANDILGNKVEWIA